MGGNCCHSVPLLGIRVVSVTFNLELPAGRFPVKCKGSGGPTAGKH
jgi:hypothetical protein